MSSRRINDDDVEKIFDLFVANEPHPKGELEHSNVYELLVAVILSAQATDVSVNKATKELFKKVSTPLQMVELGESNLKKYIKTIGLFNNKAKNVIAMSKKLIEIFDSQVPNNHRDLQTLPGVGRKTANVVLQMAFGEDTIAVDTHVFRLSHRLGLSSAKNPDGVEADLMTIIPKKYHRYAHHWLILHGRYVCTARKPNCDNCYISQYCISKGKV